MALVLRASQRQGALARARDIASENFFHELCLALRGDAAMTRRLHPVLWKAARTVRTLDMSDNDRWRAKAEAHAERLDAIARRTRALLALLPRFDPAVGDALERGYLTLDGTVLSGTFDATVTGRFSDAGRRLAAKEVWVYHFTSDEITMLLDWSAAQR